MGKCIGYMNMLKATSPLVNPLQSKTELMTVAQPFPKKLPFYDCNLMQWSLQELSNSKQPLQYTSFQPGSIAPILTFQHPRITANDSQMEFD